MRAREPDAEGYVDRGGTKLHYEVFGDRSPTLLLLGSGGLPLLVAIARDRLATVRQRLARSRDRGAS